MIAHECMLPKKSFGGDLAALLKGHAARDGAVAVALLSQPCHEPCQRAVELREDQRLGRRVPLAHVRELHANDEVK